MIKFRFTKFLLEMNLHLTVTGVAGTRLPDSKIAKDASCEKTKTVQ
jgi:hypothetical protein